MAEQQRFPWLCRGGDIEAIATAIENGADVNEEDPAYGETGLMWALEYNHNNVVQLLINLPRVDVNKVDQGYRLCAAHYAAGVDNHAGMAALLARQDLTTINHRDDHEGLSPIMEAVSFGDPLFRCFNLLLVDQRVDLDTRDAHQRSPEEVRR